MSITELKSGETFSFANGDESMYAEVFYSDHLSKFVIELNAKFVCTSKTYAPMIKKLNSLKAKYSLVELGIA